MNANLKERAESYGFNALNDSELSELAGIKSPNSFKTRALLAYAARQLATRSDETPQIKRSADIIPLLSYLCLLDHEEFVLICLTRANRVLKHITLSRGGTSGTFVDISILYREVINTPRCTTIVLAHNHPSGQLIPSEADKDLTQKIIQGGKFFSITVLDHIIMGTSSGLYYSFADNGQLF